MKDIRQKISDKMAKTAIKANTKDPEAKKVTMWRVAKFLWMPELGPRFKALGKRFGGFAFFLAQIFYSCRLIPAGHPTLQASNIGYFGFSDVISTAASNLQIRRENIDQIVMFTAVILSMALLLANGLAIAAFTVFDLSDAFAQGNFDPAGAVDAVAGTSATCTSGGGLFSAPNPNSDLALQFLDLVFGASSVDMFNCGVEMQGLGNKAIKDGIYAMLGMYSTAMMVIAVIIILYYVFTVVGESAMTGQPFGKRFNSFWAPIRLVVGLGLLVPIAGGLNAAQYGTLYAAKMGSGLASNAWSLFVEKIATTDLVGEPITPQSDSLVYNIVRFEACTAIANKYMGFGEEVKMNPKKVYDNQSTSNSKKELATVYSWQLGDTTAGDGVDAASWAALGAGGGALVGSFVPGIGTAIGAVVGAIGGGVAGLAGSLYYSSLGLAETVCGEIVVPNGINSANKGDAALVSLIDSEKMYLAYQKLVVDTAAKVRPSVIALVDKSENLEGEKDKSVTQEEISAVISATFEAKKIAQSIVDKQVKGFEEDYKNGLNKQIEAKISMFDEKGWMGAGLFYNDLADINGGFFNMITASMPRITGDIVYIPSAQDLEDLRDNKDELENEQEVKLRMSNVLGTISAAALTAQVIEDGQQENKDIRNHKENFWETIIIDIFGGDHIKAFREANANNPMANMLSLGHGLYTKGLDYIVWIIGLMAGGALISSIPVTMPLVGGLLGAIGGGMSAVGSLLVFAATLGVAIGVFLYYVIPLMPFVFFFFSVTAWVLEVVEAMVGLPLWALAHLRIDGDGLSGQAAQMGYTVIFGIIVRPFVILFAYLMGILIFSAGMVMLQKMFGDVVGSIGYGEDRPIDYVAFSGIYAVIAFTLAMLSFKQCDQMANQIMRWFGGSDPRYNDGDPNPEQSLQQAALGTAVIANQGGQAVGEMTKGVSQGAQGGAQGAGQRRDRMRSEKDAETAATDAERRHQEIMNKP